MWKIIEDLINYKGSFVPGKRKCVNNKYDVFKSFIAKLELDRIEGVFYDAIKTEPHSLTSIIKSDTKAVLKIDDKLFYHFNKDWNIKKLIILVFLMKTKSGWKLQNYVS